MKLLWKYYEGSITLKLVTLLINGKITKHLKNQLIYRFGLL